jgi:hypothetical protein
MRSMVTLPGDDRQCAIVEDWPGRYLSPQADVDMHDVMIIFFISFRIVVIWMHPMARSSVS